ncbi:MAG: TIGR04222 domain-containing membrane protein, partial [Candidatus Hodarchaeales archaeon]
MLTDLYDSFSGISGPDFLIIMSLIVVVGTIVLYIISHYWDDSLSSPLPLFTEFTPVEIASLRGGAKGVVEMATFDLAERQIIEVNANGQPLYIGKRRLPNVVVTERAESTDLSPIEKELVNYYRALHKASAQAANGTMPPFQQIQGHYLQLSSRVSDLLKPNYQKFVTNRLLMTPEEFSRAKKTMKIIYILVFGLGGVRLLNGWLLGRPILFLIFLLIGTFVLFSLVSQPLHKAMAKNIAAPSPVTRLGRKYLKALSKQFEWVKTTTSESNTDGVYPASIGVALFGLGALLNFDSQLFQELNLLTTIGWTSSGRGGGGGGCGG